MREILFRGKRIDTGAWVQGHYVKSIEENDHYSLFEKGWIYNDKGWCMYEVIPETIGQDTGLKDKNGKKIFEGDIVINQYDVKGYIAFLQQEMGYSIVYEDYDSRIGHRSRGSLYDRDYGLEVIGNINDNPELVE